MRYRLRHQTLGVVAPRCGTMSRVGNPANLVVEAMTDEVGVVVQVLR